MAGITRVFYPSHLELGNVLRLSEEERRHVYKVLRGREGDRIEIVDGVGRLFVAELVGKGKITVIEERSAIRVRDEEGKVVLYQAVPKGRHMDLVVEKATELGVKSIIPLVTERGVVKLSEGNGKVRRWRRVAEAAARQALRLCVPEIMEPVTFSRAVREVREIGILLHNGSDLPPLEDVVPGPAVCLFVGPEGGWSAGELAMTREIGLSLASLGPYRLRSETAGIVAVARACAVLEPPASSVGRRR